MRQNKWLAARYGLDTELIVDDRGNRRPARDLVDELVDLLHRSVNEKAAAAAN